VDYSTLPFLVFAVEAPTTSRHFNADTFAVIKTGEAPNAPFFGPADFPSEHVTLD
jgi:hypothetical protein